MRGCATSSSTGEIFDMLREASSSSKPRDVTTMQSGPLQSGLPTTDPEIDHPTNLGVRLRHAPPDPRLTYEPSVH